MSLDCIGLFALAAAALLAATHPGPAGPGRWWQRRWLFLVLLLGALFTVQRPAILANFQLWNPDESEMLAGALTLRERPVYWRDVDGNTCGPLNVWPLVLPSLVGLRIDYTSARLVGALVAGLTLAAVQAAVARSAGERMARLTVLPAWAFFIFNQDPEAAQYCSELVPSLLLALSVVAFGRTAGPRAAWWCGLAGLAAGAAPLAKIQAAPMAAWLFAFGAASAWRQPDRAARWAWLSAGMLAPAVVFILPAALDGAFADFAIRYLGANLVSYAWEGDQYYSDRLLTPAMLFGFGSYLWPVVGAALVAGVWAAWRRVPIDRAALLLSAGLVATVVFAAYAPGRPFGHYLLLWVAPLALLHGCLTGPAAAALSARSPAGRIAVTVALLVPAAAPAWHHFRHPDAMRAIMRTRPPLPRELIEAVQRHSRPGEMLAVWGWQPGLYVYTQTIAATPDLLTFWQIAPSRWRDFYRAAYLRDLAARRPPVFVDTVGPADFFFRHVAEQGHESFSPLAALIHRDYALAESAAGARIYVRHATAAPPPGNRGQ